MTLTLVPDPGQNLLLAALPAAERACLLSQATRVELPRGRQLHHVYFPTTAIVSLQSVMEDGAAAEIASVGSEGVVGICAFMGGRSSLTGSVVQSGGQALCIAATAVGEEFRNSPSAMQPLLRYMQALMTQLSQMAACNRHHTLEQRLCRWLLLNLDRLRGSDLLMTQEALGHLLGVRREAITGGASRLQRAGILSYVRGRISVIDRCALEDRACECYAVLKTEYDRLLPATLAA
jgi:CRP-like cAMP-binding protein